MSWLTPRRSVDQAEAAVDVAALVEQFAALLYRVAFSVVRSAPEAEDIVQETLLRAVQQGSKLAELREVRAWLARVAWNLAIDRKRRVVPLQLDQEAVAVLSRELPVDRRLAAAEELSRVLVAVDKLPKLERSVLLLLSIEDLSIAELAAVLGKSESGVRALAFRARVHLEERLKKWNRRPLRAEDGRSR